MSPRGGIVATIVVASVFVGCFGDEADTDGPGAGGDPCADPATATHAGTEGPDEIDGTDDDDIIFGLGGDDIIRGHSGNDILCGGSGDDEIGGGPGDDHIDGDDGQDLCREGPGSDTVVNCEAS